MRVPMPIKDRVTVRSAMLRNLFLLIVAFAAIVALGCWDNRREIERVLEQGYSTNAQIVGASFDRLSPLAFDGWRPRFLEQEVSIDLQWQGKDGKTYVHRKVPVSERFAGSIINGDQVKLISVPIKVLDDGTAVPVLTFDAAARLASLATWLKACGFIAFAGLAALAARAAWQRRMATAGRGAVEKSSRPVRIPPQRIMIGIVALAVGGFLTYSAWSLIEGPDGGEGAERTVQISSVTANPYTVRLSWQDSQGAVHHFGPLPISERYWREITRDGQLVVHETKVRMGGDEMMPHPVILADGPEKQWRTQLVLGIGLVLMAVGLGCLMSAIRAIRRF
jgi:hypothetical protein